MPIPLNFDLRRLSTPVRLNDSLIDNSTDWMVWWYCGIYKNKSPNSQPSALVAFRELSSRNLSDDIILRRVPLTSLGQLRIGSVWKDCVCNSTANLETDTFSVDFTKGEWKLTSFYEATKGNFQVPFPQSVYPLQYSQDKNWLLEFQLKSRGTLVIPCLEFFSRCYGRSQELKRILATYPWDGDKESVTRRLYAALNEPEEDGEWKVKLKRRLVNGDVVLLAHAKYDRYTEDAAKSIYAQIESQYNPSSNNPIFIKVTPWFQGPAQLQVKGIWFNGKKSFLGLQILGASDAKGALIVRDRENSNKATSPADDDAERAWRGSAQRVLVKAPDIIDLTGDEEPDHSAAAVEIQDPDFVVLGEPRGVVDVRKDQATSVTGPKTKGADATAFSSGEPHGAEKRVGYASIHAKQVMESHGTLRDMWNAMLHLQRKNPTSITSVSWFTFEDGFCDNHVPNVIALRPFEKQDKVGTDVRNWLYLDTARRVPRGILAARLIIKGKATYIIEIQRRPRSRKDQIGNVAESEEAFKGLAFVLDDQSRLEEWLRYVLSNVRHVRGIVRKMVGACPGIAADFKHAPAGGDEVPCEGAVLNALSKIGMMTK